MIDKVENFIIGVKAVASSVVLKLAAVGAVITAVAVTLTPLAPAVPFVGVVLPYVVAAGGVVATVSAIVKNVAEVPVDLKGWQPVSDADKALSFAAQADTDDEYVTLFD